MMNIAAVPPCVMHICNAMNRQRAQQLQVACGLGVMLGGLMLGLEGQERRLFVSSRSVESRVQYRYMYRIN
jgi:hypothetical protein